MRSQIEPLAQGLKISASDAEHYFRCGYHTLTDVEGAMGLPDRETSWFPAQTLYYGPLIDGRDLVFDFQLGLLKSVTAENPTD
jgi:hypothetical protein